MSLVIKSNVALALPKLKNLVATPNISLDFRDDEYLLNGNKTTLGSIVTLTGSTNNGYYDAAGDYKTSATNNPPVAVEPTTMKKGLLMEKAAYNLFLNSNSPKDQNITISPSFKPSCYVLSVVGDGSAKLLIDGQNIGEAFEGAPCFYTYPSGKTSAQASIQINGTLSHAAFVGMVQPVEQITRIATTGVSAAKAESYAEISAAVLATMANQGKSGCLVVRVNMPYQLDDPLKYLAQTLSVAQIKSSTTDGIYASRREGSAQNVFRVFNTSEKLLMLPQKKRELTYAINYSASSTKMACDGVLTDNIPVDLSFSALRVMFGCSLDWSINTTQYIEQVLFFDRNLTDAELQLITA